MKAFNWNFLLPHHCIITSLFELNKVLQTKRPTFDLMREINQPFEMVEANSSLILKCLNFDMTFLTKYQACAWVLIILLHLWQCPHWKQGHSYLTGFYYSHLWALTFEFPFSVFKFLQLASKMYKAFNVRNKWSASTIQ